MQPFADAWSFIKSSAVVWGPFVSGVVAAFIAAFIVHLLTQSREREKWILDCKKQEFKDLLNAMSDSYSKRLPAHGRFPQLFDEREQREFAEMQTEAFRAFRNCLYICDDLDLKKLSNDWLVALKSSDVEILHRSFDLLSFIIVQAAKRSVPKSPFQKLQVFPLKPRGKNRIQEII